MSENDDFDQLLDEAQKDITEKYEPHTPQVQEVQPAET